MKKNKKNKQPINPSYLKRINKVKQSLTSSEQTALNTLLSEIKVAGLNSKIKELYIANKNLFISLEKLMFAQGKNKLRKSGNTDFRNNAFTLIDGVRNIGGANATSFNTHFAPYRSSLRPSNLTLGVYQGQNIPISNASWIFSSTTRVSGESELLTGNQIQLNGSSTLGQVRGAIEMQTLISNVSGVQYYRGYSRVSTVGTNPSIRLNDDLNLFKNGRFNQVLYTPSSIKSYFLSTALTQSEYYSLLDALEKFFRTTSQITTNDDLVCFGDSITVAFNSSTKQLSWSQMVANNRTLRERNSGISNSSLNVGTTLRGIDRYTDLIKYRYGTNGILIIAYGVNDCQADTGTGTLATMNAFQTALETVVDYAINTIGIPSTRICLVTPFLINNVNYNATRWDNYAARVTTVASSRSTKIADALGYMRANGGTSLISGDNVHPNDSGHAAIRDCILAAL